MASNARDSRITKPNYLPRAHSCRAEAPNDRAPHSPSVRTGLAELAEAPPTNFSPRVGNILSLIYSCASRKSRSWFKSAESRSRSLPQMSLLL